MRARLACGHVRPYTRGAVSTGAIRCPYDGWQEVDTLLEPTARRVVPMIGLPLALTESASDTQQQE